MIRRVTFFKGFKWNIKDNKYLFSKGDTIIFRNQFNVIVGGQGKGKSTLMELLRSAVENFNGFTGTRSNNERFKAREHINLEIILDQGKDKQKLRAFNFQKELDKSNSFIYTTYHSVNSISYKNNNKTNVGAILDLMEPDKTIIPDRAVVLLDEPDLSLSTKASLETLNYLGRKVFDNRCQIIMSVNNPYLIQCFKEVYDIEARCWVSSEEYIDRQLSGRSGEIFNKIQNIGRL